MTAEKSRPYSAAVYARLSVADNRDNEDGDSLENQIRMIERYIQARPDFRLIGVYADNGKSGVSYERPAFGKLMNDIKAGKINCVVVKDLSRLGRNYIETGEYLERIFPGLGIRFIAINDRYDNIELTAGQMLTAGMKNLINDIYAKDISRKSSTALRIKQKKGEFIGSYAAYGYMKSKENKNKIVIDDEAAQVVRDIFRWKAEGESNAQICHRLNETGITSPCKYRYEKGILKSDKYAETRWRNETLKVILRNPVYIGHMAQGKNNFVIAENTHEPLIDKEIFIAVQMVSDGKRVETPIKGFPSGKTVGGAGCPSDSI